MLDIAPSLKETGRYDEYVKAVRTGEPMHFDGILATPPFGDRYLSVNAFRVGDGLGVIFNDITEQKLLAEEIASLARFPSENPNPVLRVTGAGTVLYGNEAASILLEAWGCAAGNSLVDEPLQIVLATLDSDQSKEMEVHSGDRTLSVTFAPIVEAGYVNIYGLDITDRKRAEEELAKHRNHLADMVRERTTQLDARVREAEELNSAMVNIMDELHYSNVKLSARSRELKTANQELDAFSYSVSHDLRAPLRHITGFITLLLKREKERLDSASSRYLTMIAESSNRMSQLIDDLLALSRTGRAEMHLRHVDSSELVREVRKELSPLTQGRRITWEVGDLPAVEADRALLRVVWQNLLGNAIKYTAPREQARIEIGATCKEAVEGQAPGEITYFVRDNGVGFDPQYTHKLFGVFQRLHRDDEFEGTGIGLATVRRIILRHDGRVWAEGEVGRGATFYFTLKEARGAE